MIFNYSTTTTNYIMHCIIYEIRSLYIIVFEHFCNSRWRKWVNCSE